MQKEADINETKIKGTNLQYLIGRGKRALLLSVKAFGFGFGPELAELVLLWKY